MIHKRDIIAALNICPRTFARWRKSDKVPPPDTDINAQSQWWHLATLEKAGIKMTATPPTPGASPGVQ